MMQNHCLVTGGAGFIGSHLVDALLAQGAEVTVLDNLDSFYDPQIKRRNISSACSDPGYTFIEGDIRDQDLLDHIFRASRYDTVFHLAARAGVRPSIEDPLLYQAVNVEGTLGLLETMRRYDCRRLIFASSSSVYGNNPTVPFRESDRVDYPISPYAATKKAGELLCHTYHHLFDMEIACLRFFTVYGPRQRPEMAIHKFTRMLAEGSEIPMFGDGSTARDYTYVDDIIQGILAIAANFTGYAIINVGESEPTTLRTLIELIADALGCEPRIRQLPMQQGDVEQTFADISIARALGYRPQTSIADGIRTFVAWYREHSSVVA